MSNMLITEITADRDGFVKEKLKDARPLVTASVKDGIVLVTESTGGIRKKIWPVSKRIAFGAIGVFADFKGAKSQKIIGLEGLQDIAVELAQSTALIYSKEDVWADDLAIVLSTLVRKIYSNYKMLPLCVEFLLAEVNDEPAHDKLIRIFPDGTPEETLDSYIILGEDEGKLDKKIAELLKNARTKLENMDASRAIDLIIKAILATRKTTDEKKKEIKFEIGILRRDSQFERLTKEVPRKVKND